ncbi:MAG: carboxypeptidase regulatory-like domain-containing protein [Chitinispirillaceae bacterium]|nr:carboxypeptidase regulatory-like domain-containing protein [Chitinispirillaceae bacterium]
MNITRNGYLLILSLLAFVNAQTSDYVTVEIPVGVKSASSVISVKWVGAAVRPMLPPIMPPDSGKIYFSRYPGGSKVSNYSDSVSVPYYDAKSKVLQDNIYYGGTPPKRGISFRAMDQKNMGVGVYYCVVALKSVADTFVSNEFQIVIESPDPVSWIGPSGKIQELTPTFSWNANPGVPYYHIILSDDIIKIDSSDGGNIDLQGLSIIWQAITPNNRMVYGAPDPSGTITADPPPLSPGQKYTWIVLNNYGNHAAYSSTRIGSPGEFEMTGLPLKKPVAVTPKNVKLSSATSKKINFRWTNLDSNANTYQLYLYIGSTYEGINAQLVVYQTEVMAQGNVDTMGVEIEAASILTTNKYMWRTIAVDDKGAGTAGDTISFEYVVPECSLEVYTKEQVRIGDNITTSDVGLVEIKVEVLDGSLEAPLLYYTDLNGNLARKRPTGSFRLTTKKDGYETQTRTINIKEGEIRKETFYLVRPEATIYGKINDASSKGINLAIISAVSDQGDTVKTNSDALGNFVLNCYPADWHVAAEKTGYKSVLPSKVTVLSGENYSYGTIALEQNPHTLSGFVRNASGAAVLGAKVRLYQEGALIEEIPSTPQNGTFAFSIPSGAYAITCEKTGFTSYSSPIDVMSSKSITILMQPGAALITGYVWGKTWVDSSIVFAPITNASLRFVNVTKTDSFSVTTDNTYGDFKVSLPGDQNYVVYSTSNGFTSRSVPCTLTTKAKTTQIFMDTLQGLGMLHGVVMLSTDRTVRANVTINLMNTASGEMAATTKSSSSGYYEIKNLKDGKYEVVAGYSGLVLDSVTNSKTVEIVNGKAEPWSVDIFMKPGDKVLKWAILDDTLFEGSIKLQSPLVKTLSIKDSLQNAGHGTYILSCDAKQSGIIDLSFHRFSVPVEITTFVDAFRMDIRHTRQDTITPVNGMVTVTLDSDSLLDSVYLYYKDPLWTTFMVEKKSTIDTVYNFLITPPKDGRTMQYYFKAFRGFDIYGYEKELYTTFIQADLGSLSRFEVIPFSEDTMTYPSGSSINFSVKGYYSSAFIPGEISNSQSVSWVLSDAQGCVLSASSGLDVSVSTGNVKTQKPVLLTITIDTTKIRMIPDAQNSITISFNVSGAALKSISIQRIDAGNPNPVKNSVSDKAEFSAQGIDELGNVLAVTPSWSIHPKFAGTISSSGVFRPSQNYVGYVKVFAQAAGIAGEYISEGSAVPGLNVRYMIMRKSIPDTAVSSEGCRIIFPAAIVREGDIGILDFSLNQLKNKIRRSTGLFKTVDSVAYEIREMENVAFDVLHDSIRMVMDIPEVYRSGKRELTIGRWSEDSLYWNMLANSTISKDKSTISASLSHFSSYSLLVRMGNAMQLDIGPNPFSPYVRPKHPQVPHYGTCISFQAESQDRNIYKVDVRIYNITGEVVWAITIPNANTNPYQIWWDGRTVTKERYIDEPLNIIALKGDKMCRNGRYFVVVSMVGADGKEKRLMKQLVLFK